MDVREMAAKLRKLDLDRQVLGKKLRSQLAKKIEPAKLNCAVAGVDGGLITKSLHGIDITMTRACAAVMRFEKNKLRKTDYFPSSLVAPKLYTDTEGMQAEEYSVKSSLYRLKEEIGLANELLDCEIDFLFLNGSIVPQQPDKPRKTSPVYPFYEQTLAQYEALFDKSAEKNINVIGVVEDSRSKRVAEMVKEQDPLLLKTIDTVLLYYALDPGEASISFPYASDPKMHPILRDFPDHAEKIKAFYLRPAKYDRPMRIEYFDHGQNYLDLAATVFALSNFHAEYGYPCVLVEADLQAKLSFHDFEEVFHEILDEVGQNPCFIPRRRELRPF